MRINTLLLKLLFVPYVLKFIQIYFLAGFIFSKNKEFYFFVVTLLLPQSVGLVVLFFAVVLSFYKKRICGWLGRSCRRRYFNIQKHYVFSYLLVVFVLSVFLSRDCVGWLLWFFCD